MGIVYEAVQVSVETRVALKVLPLQPPVDARQGNIGRNSSVGERIPGAKPVQRAETAHDNS